MKQTENSFILQGPLWKGILLFALPMAMTNILQQLFNSVDVAVVGKFCGSTALAAVGSTGPVVNLYITVFSGLAVGVNVIFSRMIGEGDESGIKKKIPMTIFLSVIIGLLLLIIGEVFTAPLLTAMGTPGDILDKAVLYLRIYMSGCVFRMVYQFLAAVLMAKGDTKRPMLCLTATGFLNVVLNLFFVLTLNMEVSGVAIATVISDAVSVVLILRLILCDYPGIKLFARLERSLVFSVLNNGIPAAMQGMLFNIANIIIQIGINSLGSGAVAASTVALNFESFTYYMIMGFANAAMTFNSQNAGAGNFERCRKATYCSLFLGMVFVYILCGSFAIFRIPLAGLYTSDLSVIELAAKRILILQLLAGINMCTEVFASSIRGLGRPYLPTIMTVIFTCAFRIVWMWAIFPKWHTYDSLIAIYPITWFATTLSIWLSYKVVFPKVVNAK